MRVARDGDKNDSDEGTKGRDERNEGHALIITEKIVDQHIP